jgi:hypothetical protein
MATPKHACLYCLEGAVVIGSLYFQAAKGRDGSRMTPASEIEEPL